ncbi:MAG: hypothetical protein AAGA54_37635 [Myxococcota bacterium]
MGYRRVEPAFCRSCGAPWTSGSDACVSCGEPLVAVQATSTDPRLVRQLKFCLGAAVLLLVGRWVGISAAFLSHEMFGLTALGGLAGVLLLATAGVWMPAREGASVASTLRGGATPAGWVLAGVLGLVAGASMALPWGEMALGLYVLEPGVFTLGDSVVVALALAAGLAAADELLLRGVLFAPVEALGGRTNAAIATAVWSTFMSLSPVGALIGVACSVVRRQSAGPWPSLLTRVCAVLVANGILYTWVMPYGL